MRPPKASRRRAPRLVAPAEVRCQAYEAVLAPDDADHGHADAHDVIRRRPGDAQRIGQPQKVADDPFDRDVVGRAIDPSMLEDGAAEPDRRRGQRVDRDLEREDDTPVGGRVDDGGGTPRDAKGDGALLVGKVGGDELADEPADGAASQPGARDELRPRLRPMHVQLPDDRGEIGAADGLAAQPDVVPTHHRVCVPLVEKVRASVHQTEPRCQAGRASLSRRSRPGIEEAGRR